MPENKGIYTLELMIGLEPTTYALTKDFPSLNLGKRKIEVVVAANTKIKEDILNKYLNDEQKSLVRIDYQALKKINCKLIKEDILVINNGLIRHDSIKLANIIFNFLLR